MQFITPQFIEVETKIFGPVAARQFIILIATAGIIFLLYRVILNKGILILISVILISLAVVVGFIKVNGRPFHYFILNVLTALIKTKSVRVWQKSASAEIFAAPKKMKIGRRIVGEGEFAKVPPARSRIAELSLVVDTGGYYKSEK